MSASQQQQQQQPPDWSLLVTENLINRASASPIGHASPPPPPPPAAAAAQQQDTHRSTPPLISPLPSNAVVISPTDQDASFQRYVENEYGPALHNRLSDQSMNSNKGSKAAYSTVKSKPSSDNTTLRMDDVPSFWTALSKDGDAKKKQDQQEKGMMPYHYDTWGYEYNATPPWWVSRFDEDGLLSAGALLFLFGFVFPPLWWIGSFWPRRPREHGGKMAERWQRLNRIMSIGFSILVVLAIIICVAVWKS
ncbi:hypothetical protein LRAMOSA10072 [Lichtheimia ramosa]|uniref:Uncharacterized protein n=1 Tax=Lichtheimia ramosa TaxID=688394 RepID=A0A077WLZ8_9FUNG|nr:hypothetical protein LRAMOSA10072 [Lichtheimia ramosa]